MLLKGSLARKLAALEADLIGPAAAPTPLERLLVARVVACWLRTAYFEAAVASSKGTGLTLAQADQQGRSLERAERALLAA